MGENAKREVRDVIAGNEAARAPCSKAIEEASSRMVN